MTAAALPRDHASSREKISQRFDKLWRDRSD
jgi:hypothetical protein